LSQNERALADFGKAIELEQLNPQYYEDRAITYLKLREFARAQTDLAMALGLDSKRPTAHREEGRLASYQGEHARAVRSFAQAMDNDDGIGVVYAAIWLHVAARRGGLSASPALLSFAEGQSFAEWPSPVIQMSPGDKWMRRSRWPSHRMSVSIRRRNARCTLRRRAVSHQREARRGKNSVRSRSSPHDRISRIRPGAAELELMKS
jgi:tetratricopeptide (TPR) repeat protein